MPDPLQQLSELIERATPGPWRVAGVDGEHDESGARIVGPESTPVARTSPRGLNYHTAPEHWHRYFADGDLIALSPSVIKAAVDLARAAREVEESAKRLGGSNDLIRAHFAMETSLAAFTGAVAAALEGGTK